MQELTAVECDATGEAAIQIATGPGADRVHVGTGGKILQAGADEVLTREVTSPRCL